jgi:molecular chaperone GrpE
MDFSRRNQQPGGGSGGSGSSGGGGPNSEDSYARGASGSEGTTGENAAALPSPSATESLEAALAESRDKYLRLAAEYDNYRKRSTRERQEERARAQADLVKGLADGLDDLARAAGIDPATTDAAHAVHAADIAERKLLKALQGAGLEVLNPVDQAFDPALHEAVGTEPALSREDDHLVARVYQPGYVFNGQLIRPARVVVKQWNG